MMKKTIISISLIAIGLSSIACRETDEMLIENEQQQLSLKARSTSNIGSQLRISNENPIKIDTNTLEATNEKDCDEPKDVPKDGTHWIISSDDDCKDPPKDGTHWRMGAAN